jgi:hypothetical protein
MPRDRANDETRRLPDMGKALSGINMGYKGQGFIRDESVPVDSNGNLTYKPYVKQPLSVEAGKPHVKVIPGPSRKTPNERGVAAYSSSYYEKKDAFGDRDEDRKFYDSKKRAEITRSNSTGRKRTIKIDSSK